MNLESKHRTTSNESIIAEYQSIGWTMVVERFANDESALQYHYYKLDKIKDWCHQQGMQYRKTYRILYRDHNNCIEYVWLFQYTHDAVLWTLRWL